MYLKIKKKNNNNSFKGLHNAAFSEHRMDEASCHKVLLRCDRRGRF